MKTQGNTDASIIRSGARIRESVRCLPKGHFQQIRQMFDKQSSSCIGMDTLSTIHERRTEKVKPSILLQSSVTDDEKLQHSILHQNADSMVEENDLLHCPVLHSKLVNKGNRRNLFCFSKIDAIICLNVSDMFYLTP